MTKGISEDLSSDDRGGMDRTNSLDSAISKIESCIQRYDKNLLMEALSDLQDYKGEEDMEPQDEEQKAHGGRGLAIMIGMPKGEQK